MKASLSSLQITLLPLSSSVSPHLLLLPSQPLIQIAPDALRIVCVGVRAERENQRFDSAQSCGRIQAERQVPRSGKSSGGRHGNRDTYLIAPGRIQMHGTTACYGVRPKTLPRCLKEAGLGYRVLTMRILEFKRFLLSFAGERNKLMNTLIDERINEYY